MIGYFPIHLLPHRWGTWLGVRSRPPAQSTPASPSQCLSLSLPHRLSHCLLTTPLIAYPSVQAVAAALCSRDALRWARSAVISRCFSVRKAGGAEAAEATMVPVVDMLDHDPAAQARVSDDDEQKVANRNARVWARGGRKGP